MKILSFILFHLGSQALSASGLRALRYAREVEGIGQVVALDNDKGKCQNLSLLILLVYGHFWGSRPFRFVCLLFKEM